MSADCIAQLIPLMTYIAALPYGGRHDDVRPRERISGDLDESHTCRCNVLFRHHVAATHARSRARARTHTHTHITINTYENTWCMGGRLNSLVYVCVATTTVEQINLWLYFSVQCLRFENLLSTLLERVHTLAPARCCVMSNTGNVSSTNSEIGRASCRERVCMLV